MAEASKSEIAVLMLVPMLVSFLLCYMFYEILKCVLKKAEVLNKSVQDELAHIEERRRKLFLEREQQGEEEFFYEKYGYSYDWVFVFDIKEEPDEKAFQVVDEKQIKGLKEEWRQNLHRDADFKKYFSMKTIVDHLQTAGLETKLFYSTQRDECYCKIRCPPARMEWMADFLDYKVVIDPDRARYAMRKGNKPVWVGRNIRDELNLCTYGVYDHIYGRFEADDEKLVLYKRHKLTAQIDSPFRNVDRIKLINEIFKQPPTGDTPGCGFELAKLQEKGCIIGFFPLHDIGAKITLEKRWLAITSLPSQQPMDMIKDYFGEKVAMYFGWLGVYTTFLGYAAVPGFITYFSNFGEGVVAGEERSDGTLTPVFAAFMALWGTVFLEFWKRQQITYTMEWGMTGFEQKETTRPAFWGSQFTSEGAPVTSHVDGSPAIHFPVSDSIKRKALGYVVTVAFVIADAFLVYSIFQLKGQMNVEPMRTQFTVLGILPLGAVIPSVLQAVLIGAMSAAWKSTSLALTVMENHRTDTQFEDSLIVKTFSFEFVNKYAACFYAAFAKKFLTMEPCDPTCFDELNVTLATLFLMELATGNALEVGTSLMGQKKREKEESMGVSPDRKMSVVEKQYTAETFDKMLGTFRNYQEMAFQFGYATLFSSAFPLAPVLAYINNFVEIRVDAWKLLQVSRRPEPEGCEDIGAWYGILDLIGTLSVVTNGLLIFFVAQEFTDYRMTTRVGLFIVFEHALLIAKAAAGVLVPDTPRSTAIQLERQEFIASKIIENRPDDLADLGKDKEVDGAFDIAENDDDPVF